MAKLKKTNVKIAFLQETISSSSAKWIKKALQHHTDVCMSIDYAAHIIHSYTYQGEKHDLRILG